MNVIFLFIIFFMSFYVDLDN